MSLKNKKILLTRPQGSAQATIGLFEDLGAKVINIPMVKTVALPAYQAMKNLDDLVKGFRFVVLGSPRGARMFCEKAGDVLTGIAAVGPGTARVVQQRLGISPALPKTFDQEGMLAMLKKRLGPGDRVLYFGAADKRKVLQNGLASVGIKCVNFDAYRTECTNPDPAQVKKAVKWADFICFFSPSAVNCMNGPGQDIQQVLAQKTIVAIGHVTGSALQKYGIDCLVPSEHTPRAMAMIMDRD